MRQSGRAWVWVGVMALLPALAGCGGQRTAEELMERAERVPQQPAPNRPAPEQQVAGERQESPDARVRRAILDAGLPERFVFGSRTWVGQALHHAQRSSVATPQGEAAEEGSVPAGGFDFVPVADLSVADHTIYRRSGPDEAVTDSIYLLAPLPARSPSETANPAAADDVTLVEYGPVGNRAPTPLHQALQATGLPQSLQQSGRMYTAREVQVYDPELFDDYSPAPTVRGHQAYVRKGNRNDLLLMGHPIPASGPNLRPIPASVPGPVFIRYEVRTAG